jgi:ribosomal protein L19
MSQVPTTATTEITTREAINELKPGDRVEVLHQVKVGQKIWNTKTVGTVVRFERRRHGLHFRRNVDDKAFSDLIVLKLADGSLTTVTMDEFSQLRRLG